MNPASTDSFDLLLAGAGHAHLGVLRSWAESAQGHPGPRRNILGILRTWAAPSPGHPGPRGTILDVLRRRAADAWAKSGRLPGRIGLLSADAYAWYSGMLPGLLGGRYQLAQCRIELAPLCAAAGVELLIGEACGLDPQRRQLRLADGAPLGFGYLSLNLGSLPPQPAQHGNGLELLAVKPFGAFIQRWQQWQQEPQPLALIGGGAAGVELALALARQVPALTLFSAGRLLAGHPAALRRRALVHLQRQGVQVHENCMIDALHDQQLLGNGRVVWQGTRALLTSGAGAQPWLQDSGLACDPQGFVRIDERLQSCSHPHICAVGDCASLARTPHNGVYAVRQGPLLAHNLLALLSQRPLARFRPQRHALALLASGDGGALASWAGLTAEGRLFGWWKDRLDQGFIQRHRL